MDVFWKQHAKERFWERGLKHNLNYGEAELALKKQKVRVSEGFDKGYLTHKFKCIAKFGNVFITFEKAETKKAIYVITLWESNEKEVGLWHQKQ